MTDISPPQKKSSRVKISHRTTARMIAVQGLYQMEMTGRTIRDIIENFKNFTYAPNIVHIDLETYDYSYTEDILRGVIQNQNVIDPLIENTLTEGWSLKRLDRVMCALLRASIYELLYAPDVPAKVVMNEYINLASAFGLNDNNSLANGVLNHIARSHNLIE